MIKPTLAALTDNNDDGPQLSLRAAPPMGDRRTPTRVRGRAPPNLHPAKPTGATQLPLRFGTVGALCLDPVARKIGVELCALVGRQYGPNLSPFLLGDRPHLDARVGVLRGAFGAISLAQLRELLRVLFVDRLDLVPLRLAQIQASQRRARASGPAVTAADRVRATSPAAYASRTRLSCPTPADTLSRGDCRGAGNGETKQCNRHETTHHSSTTFGHAGDRHHVGIHDESRRVQPNSRAAW